MQQDITRQVRAARMPPVEMQCLRGAREGSARQPLQLSARLRGQRVIAVARNEQLERRPRSRATGGFVLLRDRSRGVAGHWNGGGAPRCAALFAALIRVGLSDHVRQSSEGQLARPCERHQGAEQTGREGTWFHDFTRNTAASRNRRPCPSPYDYGI